MGEMLQAGGGWRRATEVVTEEYGLLKRRRCERDRVAKRFL